MVLDQNYLSVNSIFQPFLYLTGLELHYPPTVSDTAGRKEAFIIVTVHRELRGGPDVNQARELHAIPNKTIRVVLHYFSAVWKSFAFLFTVP